jgi:hypothetical protein
VVTGTTSDKQKSSAPPNDRQVRLQSSQGDNPVIEVDTSTHGVDDRLGLLVNLLLHKVVELTLHDLSKFDLESLDSSDGRESVILSQTVDVQFCKFEC